MKKLTPTFSIVLETENLGMANIDDLIESLESLKKQTLSIEKAREVIVVVGNHIKKETQKNIQSQYPWLKFHVSKTELEYTKAKIAGASVATGEIVVFADSDVRYEKTWLQNLLSVFTKHSDATVSSGETNMQVTSAYTLSLALSWMLNMWPKSTEKTVQTTVFALNNFAIKKSVINENPFPSLTLYRGKITFWRDHLINLGHVFYRTQGARGYHAPPGNFGDWLYRMLAYGADFVATADFTLQPNGLVIESKNIPKRIINLLVWALMRTKQFFYRLFLLAKHEPSALKHAPLGIPLALVTIITTTVGGICSLFNRDYIYQKITARESQHSA